MGANKQDRPMAIISMLTLIGYEFFFDNFLEMISPSIKLTMAIFIESIAT